MDFSDIVASLALIVSGLALWQSRRSANAADRSADAADKAAAAAGRTAESAEKMSEIDAARHHEERRPRWDLRLEKAQRRVTRPRRLVLHLVSPEVVEEVTLLSLQLDKLSFSADQEWSDSEGDTAGGGPVRRGRDVFLHVRTPQPPQGGTASVEVHSRDGGDQWTDVYEVELPPSPPRVVVARRA